VPGRRARGAAARLHAVVLAGGAGERFWPRSRRHHPKPFLEVVDGKSLLDATLARAHRFAAPGCVWIVCGQEHAAAVRRASGLPASRVLVEPQRRNTAMAVGFSALRVAAEDPDAVLAVLPADHRIPDAARFARDIKVAARAAAREGVLVTLGVTPTRPETGYGYIQVGPVADSAAGLHRVARFVEKPSLARARGFLRRGGFLWNAGIFVWSARTILGEIERCAPDVHAALTPIRERPAGRGASGAVARAFARAPSQPIDIAVLERSRCVWTLPVHFAWSDVGTWFSLACELGVGGNVTKVLNGEVWLDDAGGNLVWGEPRNGRGRLVVLLGVHGLAVIEAPDALLVASLERSPEVRRIVERLRQEGRHELT
jgi:mannose-1-phosphate guanylyltransferase/mannose-6-phosphate isomerase